MRLLCITDPHTHPPFDTTVELYSFLAKSAEIELFHSNASTISEDGEVTAISVAQALTFAEFLALETADGACRSLTDFDLVFCRTDKPQPHGHLQRLARFEDQVRFVNRPSGLLEVSRRSFLLFQEPDLFPDSLVSRDAERIARFIEHQPLSVVKTELSYGGKGVSKVERRDRNTFGVEDAGPTQKVFSSALQVAHYFLSIDQEPLTVVPYRRNVRVGDKRVLVVGEEILGAYIRRSPKGHWINNMTSGGEAIPADVEDDERQVIESTIPLYKGRGVRTLGFDFLRDDADAAWSLSEVNAGNIGGYGRLETLTGRPIYRWLEEWLLRASTEPSCPRT